MLFDDVSKLSKAVRLTGDKQLVPFSPVHVEMMDLGLFDRAYLENLPDWPGMLAGMAALGFAYTGTLEGKPMCSFGVTKMWPGLAELWMIPDIALSSVARPFHRATKLFLDVCMEELQLVRIQVTVCTLNVSADKWIRTLHFTEEGVLRKFGPEGADYKMYARLNQDVGHFIQPQISTAATRP